MVKQLSVDCEKSDIQGVVYFRSLADTRLSESEAIHTVCFTNKNVLRRSRSDFLRRHQVLNCAVIQ